jgi:mannitol/fructose-specific phosphotransferase system IIA component (Ntr-type)
MRLTRYLKPAQIRLELRTRPEPQPEDMPWHRYVWGIKQSVLQELVELLGTTGKMVNQKKLYTDLLNREKKASTAIGGGIAIPHVRSMQARGFAMAFARSTPGVEFDAIDSKPVHLFFCVVSPPYDDALYLRVYKEIGKVFGNQTARASLLSAKTDHEIIKIITDFSG